MHTDHWPKIRLSIETTMASDQRYVLKWHYHETTLIRNLPYLLENDILSDVTISVGGGNIKAHKIILAMCSVYFLQLFQDLRNIQHPVVVLHNVTLEDVKAMLSFMYKGQCVVSKEQLPNLLSVAKMLKVQGLCDMKVPEIEVISNTTIPNLVTADTTQKIPETSAHAECDRLSDTPVTNDRLNVNEKDTKQFLLVEEDKNNVHSPSCQDAADHNRYTTVDHGGISVKRQFEEGSRDIAINLTVDSKKGSGFDSPTWEKPIQVTPDNISPCSTEDINLTYPSQTSIFRKTTSTKEVSETCKCFLCGKYLSNQYNLRVHMETHEEAYHACQSCPHVSRSRDALRKHVSYRHPEEYVSRKRRKTDSS